MTRPRDMADPQIAFEKKQRAELVQDLADENPGAVVKVGSVRPRIQVNLREEPNHLVNLVAKPQTVNASYGFFTHYNVLVQFADLATEAEFQDRSAGELESEGADAMFHRTESEVVGMDDRVPDQLDAVEEYIRERWIPDYEGREVVRDE